MPSRLALWVVGPALGHTARALAVARQLRPRGIDSIFCGSDLHGYHAALLPPEFVSHNFGCPPSEPLVFADRVHRLLSDLGPDVLCFDCSPIPWVLMMRTAECRTVYLTNSFLTRLGHAPTVQDRLWQDRSIEWETQRRACGLRPVLDAREFYECDRVLLADPGVVWPVAGCLPARYRLVGPCLWEPEGSLPEELAEARELTVISLGSTGRLRLPISLLKALGTPFGSSGVVVLGRVPPGSGALEVPCYERLPGSQVLRRSRFVLTHGGTGSVYQALANGVPVGCWPTHENHSRLAEQIDRMEFGVHLINPDWAAALDSIRSRLDWLTQRVRAAATTFENGPVNAASEIAALVSA